jgi:hypothetical protein
MKQKLLQITPEQVDQMITIKWGKHAKDSSQVSFVSYSVVGKVFGIDGSSVRRMVLKRF